MQLYLSLIFGSLGLGAAYALQAMGVVVVYKTARVFNFATGGIAMVSAYVAGDIAQGHGLAIRIVGALLGVAVGGVIGLGMELTLRYSRSPLNRTVITLGWLLGLQGFVALLFGAAESKPADAIVGSTSLIHFDKGMYGDVFKLGRDQVLVIVVTVVVALGLAAFFRASRLGVSMRAVADDPEAGRLLGLNVTRIDQSAWMLGGAVSGLTGVMVVMLDGSFDQLSLIAFSIQALAAALVGQLSSLPLTLVGGFGLAMLQVVFAERFTQLSGTSDLVALFVILVALAFRRQTGRGDQSGGGLVPVAVPPLPRGKPAGFMAVASVAVVVALPFIFHGNDYVAEFGAWSMAILSLVLLTGVVGQISLCQCSFMGIGAYSAAIALSHGVPFLLAIVVGALVAGAAATIVGLPALRLSPLELAIVTISLAFAADDFLFSWAPLVSGTNTRPLPRPSFASGDRPYAYLCLGIFVLVAATVASLRRGRTGAALTALRSSPAATAAMGFSVTSAKLRGFAMSGVVAGLAGGMFAALAGVASGGPFSTLQSISLLAYAVIAGVGNIPGALVGGAILTLSTISFSTNNTASVPTGQNVTTMLTGVVLIAILLAAPTGLTGLAARLWAPAKRRLVADREAHLVEAGV